MNLAFLTRCADFSPLRLRAVDRSLGLTSTLKRDESRVPSLPLNRRNQLLGGDDPVERAKLAAHHVLRGVVREPWQSWLLCGRIRRSGPEGGIHGRGTWGRASSPRAPAWERAWRFMERKNLQG